MGECFRTIEKCRYSPPGCKWRPGCRCWKGMCFFCYIWNDRLLFGFGGLNAKLLFSFCAVSSLSGLSVVLCYEFRVNNFLYFLLDWFLLSTHLRLRKSFDHEHPHSLLTFHFSVEVLISRRGQSQFQEQRQRGAGVARAALKFKRTMTLLVPYHKDTN